MNKFLLILILICSIFVCHAQNNTIPCNAPNNYESSPFKLPFSSFANVPISLALQPIPKAPLIPKTQPKRRSKSEPIPYKVYRPDLVSADLKLILKLHLMINCYKLSSGSVAAFFSLQIEDKELAFEDTKDIQIARVEIAGEIFSIDNTSQGNFQDKIVFFVKDTDSKWQYPFNLQSYVKGILLPPGSYSIYFNLRDSVTGKHGSVLEKFEIPTP